MGGPGSGGARQGTGTKPKSRNYGEKRKTSLELALVKKAKETGKTLEEVLADLAYDEGSMMTARVGALKLIYDVLVPKESHRTVEQTVTHSGPLILPELKMDPAVLPEAAEVVMDGEVH